MDSADASNHEVVSYVIVVGPPATTNAAAAAAAAAADDIESRTARKSFWIDFAKVLVPSVGLAFAFLALTFAFVSLFQLF
jgi:hypothetical protein